MSEPRPPNVTPPTERVAAAKRARLAAELRANLARRKAQARERAASEVAPTADANDEDSAP